MASAQWHNKTLCTLFVYNALADLEISLGLVPSRVVSTAGLAVVCESRSTASFTHANIS